MAEGSARSLREAGVSVARGGVAGPHLPVRGGTDAVALPSVRGAGPSVRMSAGGPVGDGSPAPVTEEGKERRWRNVRSGY